MGCNALKINIYTDPLTGLPNFFKFIECNTNKLFGEKGSIIIFDLVNFMKVNENYGRSVGDLCLRTLAKSILKGLETIKNNFVFRTDGDEFTLVLPDLTCCKGKEIIENIKGIFNRLMSEEGYLDFEFHTLTINYDEQIQSVEQFYEIVLSSLINKENGLDDKFSRDNMLRQLIRTFTSRIKDTLSYFDDACSLALTDDISGLPNHRAGKLQLCDLVQEQAISKKGFSVLFIDGDNLKRYNQISYGCGNDMIRKLSEIIKSSLRTEDKIYRWLSGDEFLVVLKDSRMEIVLKLAERVRDIVEKGTKDWVYPVTVSIGVANYPTDGANVEDVIDKAERANAFAKTSGKNQVVRWQEGIQDNYE